MSAENRSPDPIDEPRAYQQLLLSLLGSDDPGEVQQATAAKLRQIAAEAEPHVRTVPEPGEWSVFGCMAHIVDAEVMMSTRYRWILAHDQPVLMGYDQDLWVERLHSRDEPIDGLLALFEPLREANVGLWRRSGDQERARVGLHSERGPESFDLCFRMIAGHDRFHLDQARKTLAQVREA